VEESTNWKRGEEMKWRSVVECFNQGGSVVHLTGIREG
jgi:predicted SpoU family rRNA methylase